MNQDRDNKRPTAGSDSSVSAEYRAAATERTPPAVDAMVLERAEAATKENTGLRGFTAFWFRPLAFVATLALSLALLLELTSTKYPEPAKGPESEVGRREAAAFETDPNVEMPRVPEDYRKNVDSLAGKEQSAATPAPAKTTMPSSDPGGPQQLETTPSQTNAPVVDEAVSADFADMIESSAKRMKESDRVTEVAIQGLQQTRAAEDDQAGEAAAFGASAVLPDVAARPCNEQQTADPLTWWQCIADLEKDGRHDEAKIELDLFNTAHPEFELPESLPSK